MGQRNVLTVHEFSVLSCHTTFLNELSVFVIKRYVTEFSFVLLELINNSIGVNVENHNREGVWNLILVTTYFFDYILFRQKCSSVHCIFNFLLGLSRNVAKHGLLYMINYIATLYIVTIFFPHYAAQSRAVHTT